MVTTLPKQSEDFPAWYVEVVKQSGMAEHGLARGSQVIKPWGYAIWEWIQRALDDRFKATGHENLMFPMLIPRSLFEKEAEHVEGFTPQVWVVTHAGDSELEEPLYIRPTSETVIWNAYAKWVQSYRDLPLLYNQWCNVMRAEMRTRLFLRTSEFLWQEGHTAHSTADEAHAEALRMQDVYREVAEDVLAIPVIAGRKPASERFPGAEETYTIEAMMRDTKALQSGTSHFLGQNFARAYDVSFLNDKGEQDFAWGTSWGVSTRIVGAVVMTHGDDRGLRLPPLVAPTQIVIVPIYASDSDQGRVLQAAESLRDDLSGANVRVRVDSRDQHRPGYKFSEWELKGVPVRIELGPKDLDADSAVIVDRVSGEKRRVPLAQVVQSAPEVLSEVQKGLHADALAFRDRNTHEASDFAELREGLIDQGGFWVGPWCGEFSCEEKVTEETKATIRALPRDRVDPGGPCVVCGKAGLERATWGISY
ncbi:MAG TPA: proline--tRNA ligase [Actinomycetota bacterium]|nr:proline--tRNA ligase [Actinomycetota bacterium]